LNIRIATKDGKPRYVIATNPETHDVIVGPREALYRKNVVAEEIRFFDKNIEDKLVKENQEIKCRAQIRAHGKAVKGVAKIDPNNNELRFEIEDDEEFMFDGVAAGQSIVLFDYELNSRVLAKATLTLKI
jgi:tRNA-specific 2-thiouridylase